MNIRRVLMWEIIGYWPPTLCILETTNSEIQSSLSSDLTYIHFFLEDIYKQADLRTQDWTLSKALLKTLCQDNQLLARFRPSSKELIIQNVVTNLSMTYTIQYLPYEIQGESWANMVFLSPFELFFCGEYCPKQDTYIFDLRNQQLEKKCDMNEGRGSHGLIKLNSLIYVFGGQ